MANAGQATKLWVEVKSKPDPVQEFYDLLMAAPPLGAPANPWLELLTAFKVCYESGVLPLDPQEQSGRRDEPTISGATLTRRQ
jgi:hypothetical protein